MLGDSQVCVCGGGSPRLGSPSLGIFSIKFPHMLVSGALGVGQDGGGMPGVVLGVHVLWGMLEGVGSDAEVGGDGGVILGVVLGSELCEG